MPKTRKEKAGGKTRRFGAAYLVSLGIVGSPGLNFLAF